MSKKVIDQQLITKIAHLYYEDNLSINQITNLIDLTRQTVSKAILKAKKDCIVQITIVDPEDKKLKEFEENSAKKLSLKKIFLTDVFNYENDYLVKNVAQLGAKVFLGLLKPNMKIGVSLGRTIYELTEYLNELKDNSLRLSIVEIIGGMSRISDVSMGSDIPRRFSQKIKAIIYYLSAPAFTKDITTRDAMLRDENINKTLSEKIDMFFVGIGNVFADTTLIKNEIIRPEEYKELLKKEAVGVINGTFYDINGKIIDFSGNDRRIAISLENLINHPFSVGLAGGIDKEKSIVGAIKGKFINRLITDRKTLEKVLKIYG